jgi:hypothetical protein
LFEAVIGALAATGWKSIPDPMQRYRQKVVAIRKCRVADIARERDEFLPDTSMQRE